MKKFFSLILVAMLMLSPICAYAAEDVQALTPSTNEESPQIVSESPALETTVEAPVQTEVPTQTDVLAQSEEPAQTDVPAQTEEPTQMEVPAQSVAPDTTTTEAPSSEEKLNTEGKQPSGEEAVVDSDKEATEKTDTDTDKKDAEKTDKKLNELEKDLDKEPDEELEKAKKKDPIPEHEHVFTYTSNGDGTHTIKCSAPVIKDVGEGDESERIEEACDYEETEDCTFDAEGKFCTLCGYEKPKPKFEPSVSLSFSNSTCTIGRDDPVICMNISAEDFDIEFAQVCLANYSQNKYINVALAHGRYYNHETQEFVTEGEGWYASPDITKDFAAGGYSVRSIYVRSTNGDEVHKSIESGNLPEGLQSNGIELVTATPIDILKDLIPLGQVEESVTAEPVKEPDAEELAIDKMIEEIPEVVPEIEDEVPVVEDEIPVVEEPVETVEEEVKAVDEVAPVENTKPAETTKPVEDVAPEAQTKTVEETVSKPKSNEENIVQEPVAEDKPAEETKPTKYKEQPTSEQKTSEDKTSSTDNSTNTNSTNNSNQQKSNTTNQKNSTGNPFLDFLKRLFGFK